MSNADCPHGHVIGNCPICDKLGATGDYPDGMRFAPLGPKNCPARYVNKLLLTLGLPYPAWLEVLEILVAAREGGTKITPEQQEAGEMLAELVDHAFGQYVLEHDAPKGSA
jgi:hypothetical protein